ncbi:MAG: ketoacyl-ACP synthase III [Bacteroidota bacterium]
MRAAITHINSYLPNRIISNDEIEHWVNKSETWLPPGCMERLFGIRERRYADENQQTSDLAMLAATPIVEQVGAYTIDCLIFAAACSDLLEPATANIVQQKLGLHCPVFDVKNACNSFVNGIQVASSFIQSGIYKNVLVVNGEILHHSIRFNLEPHEDISRRLASYTFGDGGAAALLSTSTDVSGLYYQKFKSNGEHWKLCTIMGGGSLFPHDPNKYYFEGFTSELKTQLIEESNGMVAEALLKTGWKSDEITHVFTHQVSMNTFDVVAQHAGMCKTKFRSIFQSTGNTAAASIPLAMHQTFEQGKLKRGDKILIIGLAAGVSISIQLIIW